ncbi:MAG: integrase core domain-containing protein, partial [Planctomycetes bacterium]|nr:integrase core domain-containing protein [Planctomycetota bacterium]
VISSLKKLRKRHYQPAWIRTDNGMEFAAQALQNWLGDRDVKSHFIAPGSPWENGNNERFNGTLRNEHLDMDQLYGLLDARVKVGMFRDYYNNPETYRQIKTSPQCFD